jgi:PEGA domain
MKCPNCLNNLNANFSTCPYCRKQLPKMPTSTIHEVEKFHFEYNSNTKFLRGAFQLFLLFACVIALAFGIHYHISAQPETVSNTPLPEIATESASSNIAPSVAPVVEEVAPIAQPTPAVIAAPKAAIREQVQRISILSNAVASTAQANNNSRLVIASNVQPVLAIRNPTVIHNSADSLPRRKQKVITPVRHEIPPAPEFTNVNSSNSELRLEVDSSAVVLQKNIGLVSINSYVPARIYIDGQFSGMTPRAVKLVAGEHNISLLADGYREYSRKVKVDGHQQIGMVASMAKKNPAQVAGVPEQ